MIKLILKEEFPFSPKLESWSLADLNGLYYFIDGRSHLFDINNRTLLEKHWSVEVDTSDYKIAEIKLGDDIIERSMSFSKAFTLRKHKAVISFMEAFYAGAAIYSIIRINDNKLISIGDEMEADGEENCIIEAIDYHKESGQLWAFYNYKKGYGGCVLNVKIKKPVADEIIENTVKAVKGNTELKIMRFYEDGAELWRNVLEDNGLIPNAENKHPWILEIGSKLIQDGLNGNTIKTANQTLLISEEQKWLIDQFAIVSPDFDMNKIYTLNRIEFTITPNLIIEKP